MSSTSSDSRNSLGQFRRDDTPLILGKYSHTAYRRFWSKVRVGDGCWLWQGCRQWFGYGVFCCRRGRSKLPCGRRRTHKDRAHRVAWELSHNKLIPDGLHCMHSCDTPGCVRPSHLRLGSHAENMQDMFAKGRRGRPGNAKLTEDQVREIRCLHSAGLTGRELARRFPVKEMAISNIVNRKTWGDVL